MGTSPRGHLASLDGLRAIAVVMVLVSHTMLTHGPFTWWAPGPSGVRLFFVLSGFLITGILLRARDTAASMRAILQAFYVRRALRIMPLAAVAIVVAAGLGVPAVRAYLPWFLSYTINVKMAMLRDVFPAENGGHFWSLAVEEQFYLVWPFVVLYVPRRQLAPAFVALAAGAVLLQYALLARGETAAAYVLMPARLDALAAGGWLALAHHVEWRLPRVELLLMAAALIGVQAAGGDGRALPTSLGEVGWVALSVLAVDLTARHAAAPMLATGPLQYLGRISYGIYVWHGFVSAVVPQPELGLLRFVCVSSVTVLIASASWFGFERWILSQNRRWPMPARRVAVLPLAEIGW